MRSTISSSGGQPSPSSGAWYNLQGFNIVLPVGDWEGYYRIPLLLARASAGFIPGLTTLSISNNGESSSSWTMRSATNGIPEWQISHYCSGTVTNTTKTTYYLNGMTQTTGITAINIQASTGDSKLAVLNFTCAYL